MFICMTAVLVLEFVVHVLVVTIVTLIIGMAKNDYYYNLSALNRKQLKYARVVFEYIRAILPPVSERTME